MELYAKYNINKMSSNTASNKYIFPFSTCERSDTSSWVAQPYSAFINAISTIILLAMMMQAEPLVSKPTILSYALFEAWHTYSHMVHIPGESQTLVVHILGYSISFTTLAAIIILSGSGMPAWWFVLGLMVIIVSDIALFIRVGGLPIIISGLAIFAFIVIANYKLLPPHFYHLLPYFMVGLALLIALFVNESYNCQSMMESRQLPYHAITEIVGLVLFTMLGWCFIHKN